ncbi:arginase family protein [Tunturibacter empetritectus]|uniref:Arginase family enzyme n=1 Tax=Tunturiibacter empetritectus TaxID=3069691 RepID=A0A7W8IJF0_9BACT|nr:arginase family protein [Edaphobacter lichenicola]MBB5318228.1 arginase family enzyme [Edaphobacter lichenicola]
MKRREFLTTAGAAALGLTLDSAYADGQPVPTAASPIQPPPNAQRTTPAYLILGVPLRAGSLIPGNENDAQAYRDADLVKRLNDAGRNAVDAGNLPIPSYLPHHSVPPIRSWPAPRIVWDLLSEHLTGILSQPGQTPLLIGCDCSVVVGTAQALSKVASNDIHVLYIDGDCDDAAPVSSRSQSAAACAVWFLTHDSAFWNGPPLKPSQVSFIGWSTPSQSPETPIKSTSLADLRRIGIRQSAQQILAAIPPSAAILLHLDIDVFRGSDLTAIYFPHEQGLSLEEGKELLGLFLQDPRIRHIEISEYAALRDVGQNSVHQLVQILVDKLPPSKPKATSPC